MRKWLRSWTSEQKFYVFIFAIVAISLYAGLADYDWYWQVELGKAIVKEGNFNAIYTLQWGTKGVAEYLDHEWLTNIFFYLCSLTGTYGISVAKAAICVVYVLATGYFLSSGGKSYNDTSLIGICGYLFVMATVFIKVKAYILSVAFLLVEVAFLKRYKASRDMKYFVYMFILTVLWNNMHSGSIPMLFLVAGVYWLTELRDDPKVISVGLICAAGLCINPYGYKLVVFDLMHNFDPVMKEIVLDWRCIDGKETVGVICALLVLGVVFFLIGTDIREHKFDLVMIGLVLYMSFQSARHLIYLAPFFYSVVLDNKYEFKLNKTVKFYATWFCVGIAVLSWMQGFGSEDYERSYAMNYMEPELVDILLETNADSSDGLYTCAGGTQVWTLGLKAFASGAFPCTRERALAEYEMTYSASEARISELIEEWGLTKFLAIKYNPAISYSDGNGVLYDYLVKNDEYQLLYDSDFYYYFVRKDLVA